MVKSSIPPKRAKPRALSGGVNRAVRTRYKSAKGLSFPRKNQTAYERVMERAGRPYKPLSKRTPTFRNPIFVAYDVLNTPAEIRAFMGTYLKMEAPLLAKKTEKSVASAREAIVKGAINGTGYISPETTKLWRTALKGLAKQS